MQICESLLCSKHFATSAIYPGGRLKKDAEPFLYPVELNDEDIDNLGDIRLREYYRIQMLEAQLKRKNRCIRILKKNIDKLTRISNSRKTTIFRLRKKIQTGNISDENLSNALSRWVQGSVLTFIKMQLFHKTQCTYNEEEKILAKKIHYTSPSLYMKMREEFGFILPGRSTITTWFNVVHLWPGISKTLFQNLKAKVDCMDNMERNCALIFYEMRIKKCFDFHEGRQKIEGFQDLGALGCNATVATSVLVFMVRGLLHNWKQPL